MSEEKLALSVPIDEDGFPTLDFRQWDYAGNPIVLFAVVYELDLAVKNGGIQFVDGDVVDVYMEDGAWHIRAPELLTKTALHTLARVVEVMAETMTQPVFAILHEERLKEKYAGTEIVKPPTGIMVPGIQ